MLFNEGINEVRFTARGGEDRFVKIELAALEAVMLWVGHHLCVGEPNQMAAIGSPIAAV